MKKIFYASVVIIILLSACGSNLTATSKPATATEGAPTQILPTDPPASPTVMPTSADTTTSKPVASSSTDCKDAAAFVSDVTVPDYARMEPRQSFTKTWRIKNIGTCNWTPEYTAIYSSGDLLGSSSPVPFNATIAGTEMEISIEMAASGRDGTYKTFYQLRNASGGPIPVDDGAMIWAIITVGKTVVYAPSTPAPRTTSSSGSTGGGNTGGCVTQGNDDFVNQTLSLINSARAANGLPALTMNAQLNSAGQAHSADMACSGSLSHSGSDGSSEAARIAAAGYRASIARENIYAEPPQYGGNPQSAMDWWMNSQIHRDAILNSRVKDVGIGYAYYPKSPLGGYFTVVFATP